MQMNFGIADNVRNLMDALMLCNAGGSCIYRSRTKADTEDFGDIQKNALAILAGVKKSGYGLPVE